MKDDSLKGAREVSNCARHSVQRTRVRFVSNPLIVLSASGQDSFVASKTTTLNGETLVHRPKVSRIPATKISRLGIGEHLYGDIEIGKKRQCKANDALVGRNPVEQGSLLSIAVPLLLLKPICMSLAFVCEVRFMCGGPASRRCTVEGRRIAMGRADEEYVPKIKRRQQAHRRSPALSQERVSNSASVWVALCVSEG